MRIKSRVARRSVNPIRVQAFEFIFEFNEFGIDKTQPRVVDFQIRLFGFNFNRQTKVNRFSINQKSFDDDRRR